MFEKPNLEEIEIISILNKKYNIKTNKIKFLSIGANHDTAVYEAVTDNFKYFLKIKFGKLDKTSILIQKLLSRKKFQYITPLIETVANKQLVHTNKFDLIVYKYINGKSADKIKMSAKNWFDFGLGLKNLHSIKIPKSLIKEVKKESYSSKWRKLLLKNIFFAYKKNLFCTKKPKLISYLKSKTFIILNLIRKTEKLGKNLKNKKLPKVLCHGDIHAANLLISSKNKLYFVDFDTLILAPKERDLMFIGGGVIGWNTKSESEMFYNSYGETNIDYQALAYYRYERIIKHLAIVIDGLLLKTMSKKDIEINTEYLINNFKSGGALDIANKTYARINRNSKIYR